MLAPVIYTTHSNTNANAKNCCAEIKKDRHTSGKQPTKYCGEKDPTRKNYAARSQQTREASRTNLNPQKSVKNK